VRSWLVMVAVSACGTDAAAPRLPSRDDPGSARGAAGPAVAAPPAHRAYPELGAALRATIPADARVIGLGEVDVVVPALAAADPASRRQPWFPLAGAPRDPGNPVLVWARGERSFVVVLAPP
jgi:hypothetical protein